MKTYQVSYDFHHESEAVYHRFAALLRVMKAEHAQFSVWFVNFDGTAIELGATLSPQLTRADELIVSEINTSNTVATTGTQSWRALSAIVASTENAMRLARAIRAVTQLRKKSSPPPFKLTKRQ